MSHYYNAILISRFQNSPPSSMLKLLRASQDVIHGQIYSVTTLCWCNDLSWHSVRLNPIEYVDFVTTVKFISIYSFQTSDFVNRIMIVFLFYFKRSTPDCEQVDFHFLLLLSYLNDGWTLFAVPPPTGPEPNNMENSFTFTLNYRCKDAVLFSK